MTISELKQIIEEQKQENIKLFTPIQYRIHEESSQPILKKWREGSTKLKALLNELYKLEIIERNEKIVDEENKNVTKTFVNGYGEATNRYITSQTYERTVKRNQKAILSFIRKR